MKQLTDARFLSGNLSPSTQERLKAFVSLLDKWRRITNLISEKSFDNIWGRHIADCLQIRKIAPLAKRWLDVGSGAGLPGLILAIELAEIEGTSVDCVESDSRKCAFLREAVRELDIPAIVHNERFKATNFGRDYNIEAITARGYASTKVILNEVDALMFRGAPLILPKGRNFQAELAASDIDQYIVSQWQSAIEADSVILCIQKRGATPELCAGNL